VPRKKPNYSVAFTSVADDSAMEARRRRMAALEEAKNAAPAAWQSRKSEYTRESILRAVIDVLAQEGYSRLTMTLVANRAGLTKGALQHYFSSKAEAVEATLALIFEDQLELQRESKRRPLEPADEQLHDRRVEALWEYVQAPSYVAFMEIAMAARKEPNLRRLVQAYYGEYYRLSREAATELLPEWQSDVAKFNFVAHLVSTILEGMSVRQEFGITDEDEDRRVRTFLKFTIGEIFTDRLPFPRDD
jgi:AcrR family transcriptional regulator